MRTGKLFYSIVIKTLTSSLDSHQDASEVWDAGVSARASVTQIDGTRYLNEQELIDKEVYEIELWDNGWSSNIKIEYNGKTLYPIRPPARNADKSGRAVFKIIAATKA